MKLRYILYLNLLFIGHFISCPSFGSEKGQKNGQKYTQKYSFEFKGIPFFHTFNFNWDEASGTPKSIDVINSDNDEKIQTISFAKDQVQIPYSEINAPNSNHLHEKIIDLIDYDFDGHADLRILKSWPYIPGQKGYLVYIFDIKKNQYNLNEEISNLPGPIPMPAEKLIESTEILAYGGEEFTTKFYRIRKDGTLDVHKKISQKVVDSKDLTIERNIFLKKNGVLQLQCTFVAKQEGTPTLKWGPGKSCKNLYEFNSKNELQ